MKLTLNVSEDAELRAYVKDLIKGQVSAIVRDEFYAMMSEEIHKKVVTESARSLNYYLSEAAERLLTQKSDWKGVSDTMLSAVEKKVDVIFNNDHILNLINDIVRDRMKKILASIPV